jgi:cytoskeleton protein RodZ
VAAFPPASGVASAASSPAVEFVSAPAALPEVAASLPASAPVVTPTVPASAPLPVPTTGAVLRVTARTESWVEVADAQGQVLLSRVLRQGEQQEFSGAPPYKVRVGNVSGTGIEWRGSAVDLAARASNNIARLELK